MRELGTGGDDDCVELPYKVAEQGILDDELTLIKARHFRGDIGVIDVIDDELRARWRTLSLNCADLKKEEDSGYSSMPIMTGEFSGTFTSPTTLRYFFSECIHLYHHYQSPPPVYPPKAVE